MGIRQLLPQCWIGGCPPPQHFAWIESAFMASWFYASDGTQYGPFRAPQIRALVSQGVIRAETFLWTEGMPAWRKASEIQGLLPAAAAPAAAFQPKDVPVRTNVTEAGVLSIDIGKWDLLWRSVVFGFCMMFVVPAPWVATWFGKWIVSRIRMPGHQDLGFAGKPRDIWYVFMAAGLLIQAAGAASIPFFLLLVLVLQGFASQPMSPWDMAAGLLTHAPGTTGIPFLLLLAVLVVLGFVTWMIIRWVVANFSSKGQRLAISFNGSIAGYIGWYLLTIVSAITIVGWAWVIVFWIRWICRNIAGMRRQIVFNGTGSQILWRSILFGIGCLFLIPLPWVLHWHARWYMSQFALVERPPIARF